MIPSFITSDHLRKLPNRACWLVVEKGLRMGILNLWREERGNVLRKQFDDLKQRMDAADADAKLACFNCIKSTANDVSGGYADASSADRKQILRHAAKVSRQLWDRGDWPQALGLGIIMLNAESRFVPGDDAAYVRAATDALIKEAQSPRVQRTNSEASASASSSASC